MSEKTKNLLLVISIIVVGISLGIVANHFFPCKDYMTPLFIVLAIHIYLEDMFKRERSKKQWTSGPGRIWTALWWPFLEAADWNCFKAVANTCIESELWVPESAVRFSGGWREGSKKKFSSGVNKSRLVRGLCESLWGRTQERVQYVGIYKNRSWRRDQWQGWKVFQSGRIWLTSKIRKYECKT